MPSDQQQPQKSVGQSRLAIGVGLAFAATLVLLYALFWQGAEPESTANAPETSTPLPQPAPDVENSISTGQSDQNNSEAAQEPKSSQADVPADNMTDVQVQPDTVPGLFIDVLRLDADGQLLIAGRGAPQTDLRMLLGGDVLALGQSDSAGQFALFATIAPSDAPRLVQLQQKWQGQWDISVAEAVIDGMRIVVAEAAQPSATQTPSNSEDETAPAEQADMSNDITQSETAASQPSISSATGTVIVSDTEGVRVIPQGQTATTAQIDIPAEVFILSINYDAAGQAVVQGRASVGAAVRLYVNAIMKSTAPVASDGQWQAVLQDVQPGVYQLRADLLDAEGQVVARAQTPFKRENPDAIVAAQTNRDMGGAPESETAGAAASLPIRQVTVQPGATLWAISRMRYGQGISYLAVFEANKDQILDPNLIYPGQVFTLPELPKK